VQASSLWPRLTKWLTPPLVPAFSESQLIKGHDSDLDCSALTWMVTSLPSQNEVAASIHVIGSLDSPWRYQALTLDQQIRDEVASQFIDRIKTPVRSIADMLEVSRTLRAVIFLGMLPQQEQTPWIHDTLLVDALHKWMRIPYFDLWILCEHTLTQISSWARLQPFEIVRDWVCLRPGANLSNGDEALPLMNGSTFLLMLQTANARRWSVDDLVSLALAYTIPALMEESPSARLLLDEFIVQFDRAFDTYYAGHGGDSGDRLGVIKETRSRFRTDGHRMRMFFQRWEAVSRHQWYLQIKDSLWPYAFRDLVNLACLLRDASDGEEFRTMQLSRMEGILNYLGAEHALYATWTVDTAARAAALLQLAIFNEGKCSAYSLTDGPPFYWSSKLGGITRNLFVHAIRKSNQDTQDTLNTLVYAIGEKFAPGTFHRYIYDPKEPTLHLALEDSILNLLRPVSLKVLPKERPETVSAWSLAQRSEITHPDHPAIAASFATELYQIHLAYPLVDVSPYFNQLVGEDRGAKLIKVSPSDGVKICRHAKRVEHKWWQSLEPILLEEEWPTAQVFVDAVNAEGPCCDICPETQTELPEQQMQAAYQ